MSAATEEAPVRLDASLCKACGICIDLCPTHVFDAAEMGEAVLARPEDCTQCLLCELHCPDFAIEVRRREKKGAAEGPAADESHEEHAKRVYAALAGAKSDKTAEVTGDQHRCASDHEEH